MFKAEYSFRGLHAEKVNKLKAEFSSEIKSGIFKTNVSIYTVAPLIGFLYGCKSEIDKNSTETTKIFPGDMINHCINLQYNYQLIMLLDEKNEPSLQKRIDKAFRYYDSPAAVNDELLFEEYVRGGIDILYEKIIVGSVNSDDYIIRLYEFIKDFNKRYNEEVSTDRIMELNQLAKI